MNLSLRTRSRISVLVPISVLSLAWTLSLAGVGSGEPDPGSTPAAQAAEEPEAVVPAEEIDKPASVSTPDQAGKGFKGTQAEIDAIVSTSSTNGIPASALTAYQRAETVINAADETCHLTWQLIAAIGRVESNHGRVNGSALNADGIAVPGIYGLPLNGKNRTTKITDTDGGALDRDTTYDRAVGPMQFIPSTWAQVAVDADDDGQRNPQDIDDAALATAVYLCSGNGDLSTLPGQRAAVYRYNHSQSYVDLVLSIMENYLAGDYTSVPNSIRAASYIPTRPVRPGPGPDSSDAVEETAEQAPQDQPADDPTQEPEPDQADQPDQPDKSDKSDKPGKKPKSPTVKLPDLGKGPKTGVKPVDDVVKVVDDVLSLAEAALQCTLEGRINNPLVANDPYDKCVRKYTRG